MECKIIKNDTNYNLDDLTKLLNTSYWAKDRKKETVKKTVENSLCYFAYDKDKFNWFCKSNNRLYYKLLYMRCNSR